jgi:hypothetical protein
VSPVGQRLPARVITTGTVHAVDTDQVARLAALVLETYSPAALDPGVTEPTIVTMPDGFRALAVPRDQMQEPMRSLRLLDAAALGPVLVVTFAWDDQDDGTIFVMPLDTRDLQLDLADDISVTTFLVQHIEHTLHGPRESWESARSTPISRRLAVVRPRTAHG